MREVGLLGCALERTPLMLVGTGDKGLGSGFGQCYRDFSSDFSAFSSLIQEALQLLPSCLLVLLSFSPSSGFTVFIFLSNPAIALKSRILF